MDGWMEVACDRLERKGGREREMLEAEWLSVPGLGRVKEVEEEAQRQQQLTGCGFNSLNSLT